MFHDLGLTPKYRRTDQRFELDGADAARTFLLAHGHSHDEARIGGVDAAVDGGQCQLVAGSAPGQNAQFGVDPGHAQAERRASGGDHPVRPRCGAEVELGDERLR